MVDSYWVFFELLSNLWGKSLLENTLLIGKQKERSIFVQGLHTGHRNVEDSVLQDAEHSLPGLPKLSGLNVFSESKWGTLTWSDTETLWQMEGSSLDFSGLIVVLSASCMWISVDNNG